MSRSICKPAVFVVAAIAVVAGVSHLATAQSAAPDVLATLNDNDGILVDKGTFKVVKGNGAKSNPGATLKEMGAKEVSASAIIYRSGDKLYIVDGTPPPNRPQYSKNLAEWCPTCSWYTPGSYMK